jgi:hypothetical protein
MRLFRSGCRVGFGMTNLPIACALDPAELAARRDALLPGLAAHA